MEDVLVIVDKFIIPIDFFILGFGADLNCLLILGRSFLNTGRVLIDIHEGKLTLRVRNESVEFHMSKMMKYPFNNEFCMRVEVIDEYVKQSLSNENKPKKGLTLGKEDDGEIETTYVKPELLLRSDSLNPPSVERPPQLELKRLPT